MAGLIGEGVSLRGIHVEEFNWTWNITGAVTTADVGKLVTVDTTADNSVKLAGDTDAPLGRLASVEVRVQEGVTVGTVELKGSFSMPTTGAITRGASIQGSATPGVAKAAAAGANNTLVVAVDAPNNTAVVVFK